MKNAPIDLCRQFAPFEDSSSALESRTWLEALAVTGKTQGWDELLETPFIAVLGEAGTGKTTEFKSTAERLRRSGRAAFFAPIVKLSKGGVESAVPLAEHDRLGDWGEGDEEAVFFLDSVDEAELVQESLETALQKLAIGLGENKDRVRVVVSCRVSDWHEDTGRRALADFVRALGRDPEQDLKIMQMMPLAERQVRRLAEARGAEDVDGLIDAIRAAAAEPFVERPLDVELLVPLWNRDGKLGSLTDLVERSVEFRLSERRPSTCPPSTLAPERASLGLERLAGIAALSGRDSFLLSGQAPAGALGQDALDPQKILSDWSPAELRELFTRGIFDESTYGRVRIHHRSVQEYLAARWLLGMSESGLSRRDLDRLMVRQEGDREVIPGHLMPIAAWLAAWHAPTRDRLIGLNPDALLQHGDPGSLRPDAQERALGAYLQLYSGRERLHGRFDRVPLRRFAPALGDAVAEHLRCEGLPPEAQKLLLTLATEGRLVQCAEKAAELALDEGAESPVRCEAFRAVAATGDEARRRSLAAAALSLPGPWDRDAAGAFASGFFPTAISPSELGGLLRRLEPGSPNSITSIEGFAWRLPEACPEGQRLVMLEELGRTLQAAERNRGWLQRATQELAAAVVSGLLEAAEPPPGLRAALELVGQLDSQEFGAHESRERLAESLSGKPRVRRWLFWQRVERARLRLGQWPRHAGQLYEHRALIQLGPGDISWLLEDATRGAEPQARLLAFAVALVWNRSEPRISALLAGAVEGDEALSGMLAQDERRRDAPPPPTPEWVLEQREREAEQEREKEEDLNVLRSSIEELRSGEHRYFLSVVVSRSPSSREDQGFEPGKAREQFGDDIADAVSAGLKRCWREGSPPFQFEEKTRSAISGDILLGLAGLQLDFDEGLEAFGLSPGELRLASRYAARQLNTFPDWLEAVAAADPEAVTEEWAPALEADLGLPAGGESHPELLNRWRGFPEPLRSLIASRLLAALEAETPRNLNALDYSLSACLFLGPDESERLKHLCEERVHSAQSVKEGALWWRTLVSMDPLGAVALLEHFADLASAEDLEEVVESLSAELDGSWMGDASPWARSLLSHVEALERLIPLAYGNARPKSDLQNGTRFARVIGPRDHAESFRNRLFPALSGIGTTEAVEALERISATPTLAEFRDLLLRYAEETLERSPETAPMSPRAALDWASSHALPIKTPNTLFRAVLDDLDDIREWVEREEFSYRNAFHAQPESEFQRLFADKLQEKAQRRGYVVNREPEVDDEKEPDIRVGHSACPRRPVSIEMKVAEEYSIPELKTALRTQLVGQYLRRDRSRHGVLLLCSRPKEKPDTRKKKGRRKPRKEWELGAKLVALERVVELLRAEAETLKGENPDIDGLEVVVVDFH